jgi:DNA-binding transcriptional LysR family regulator
MVTSPARKRKRRIDVNPRLKGVNRYRSRVPELRQLRTFVAVAEELGFTRAAARLGVGQQAVSKAVARLEDELGVELLERTTREVRLTPAGAALLEPARRALAAADSAVAAAREAGGVPTGTVRIGVTPAIGAREREDAVAAIRRDAPDVAVAVHEVRPRDVGRLLASRELELALARSRVGGPEVAAAELRPTPVALFVAAGHRLAGNRPVAPEELDGERLLTWNPPGTAFTDLLLARLAEAGARVEPVESRITGVGSGSELVALDAVAVMPADWPISDGAVRVPLAGDLALPLLVLWPLGAASPAVRRLREAMA